MVYLLYVPEQHIRGFKVLGYFKEYPDQNEINEIVKAQDPENYEEGEKPKEHVDYRVEECHQLV